MADFDENARDATRLRLKGREKTELDAFYEITEEKIKNGKPSLAVVGGMFATGGSLLGKFAGGIQVVSVASLLLKGIFLVLMVTSNTVGCMFFVKALNASGSSLPVTIASAATSYVCSALAGFLIFGESLSITWWCGISLVVLGLLFICRSSTDNRDSALAEERKHQ